MKDILFYKISLIAIGLLSFNTFHLSAQPSNEIFIRKDIVYGHAGGTELKLDLAEPTGHAGPFPLIIFFHGGGWQAGDKSHGHHWISMFADSGFVGATVGYRFAPEFKWPSQVQDAKAAIKFLRSNASLFNIDPGRIAVMGESAGGYLALMAGVTDQADSLEGDSGSAQVSSRVQAVVSYFSVSDFSLPAGKLSPEVEAGVMQYYKKPLDQVLAEFFGTRNPDESLLKKMSVITYVDKSDPPLQIFQGDADPFVSVNQAQRLDSALEKANVFHELVIVKGGGHGWTGELQDQTNKKMFRFLRQQLLPLK